MFDNADDPEPRCIGLGVRLLLRYPRVSASHRDVTFSFLGSEIYVRVAGLALLLIGNVPMI